MHLSVLFSKLHINKLFYSLSSWQFVICCLCMFLLSFSNLFQPRVGYKLRILSSVSLHFPVISFCTVLTYLSLPQVPLLKDNSVVYVCVCMRVCVYVCMYVYNTYVYMYIYMYMYVYIYTHTYIYIWQASLVAQSVKNLPAMQETWVWSLGREDPLAKEMATHSSTLAWRIPWIGEPGKLQYMVSQELDTT